MAHNVVDQDVIAMLKVGNDKVFFVKDFVEKISQPTFTSLSEFENVLDPWPVTDWQSVFNVIKGFVCCIQKYDVGVRLQASLLEAMPVGLLHFLQKNLAQLYDHIVDVYNADVK